MSERSSHLTPTSTVEEALALLERTSAFAAVVFDHSEPVGVVTRIALCGHVGSRPRANAIVADVMDFEVVGLDPAADIPCTLDAYTEAAWHSLGRRRPMADDTVERRHRAFDRDLAPWTI